jgi:GNAT superfamily N-acetyltransferase
MTLRIEPLAAHPDAIPVVAQWCFGEWGALYPGETLEDWRRAIARDAAGDGIPTVLVALDARAPVGTASLVAHDIDDDPRGPWLASVFVAPAARGRGVASALVGAVEGRAAGLGVARLHLFTTSKMPLYAGLGWRTIERRDYRGKRIEIMTKTLRAGGTDVD